MMSNSTNWHRERKLQLVAYKGGKCADCDGIFPQCCYDFDHRDPSQKSFSISEKMSRGLPISELMIEADKCDLVCANCHRIRTAGNPNIAAMISAGCKGLIPHNKGKIMSEEYRAYISGVRTEKEEERKKAGIPHHNKGQVISSEQRKKISDTLKAKGIRPSIEACRLGGQAVTGEPKRRWGNKFAKRKEVIT